MSTISLTKPKSTGVTNVWPQVDLLPPEVRQGRKLGQTKRLLALGVLAVVLLSLLGWVYAQSTLSNANRELAHAKGETERLTAEQATYAEVPQIQGQLASAQNAIGVATSTEVLWKQYVDALRAVTPEAVSYESMKATVSSDPTANLSSDPLQAPSLGQIAFTARALKLPDMASWMDAVAAVPGFSDPWFNQASVTDEDGVVYYQVTGTVQINDEALAHRFDTTEDAVSDTTSGAATPEPTAPASGGNS